MKKEKKLSDLVKEIAKEKGMDESEVWARLRLYG